MRNTTPAKDWNITKELEEEIGEVTRAIALAIDRGVVRATPVDTGRARSNWIVSIGKRSKDKDIHKFGTSKAPKGWGKALAQGKEEISKAPTYTKINITNNLPYIAALNDGHSQQAQPSKYIEREIERVISKYESRQK